MEVFSFAISKAPKIFKQLVKENEIDESTVDYYLLHQANRKINDFIGKKLKIEPEKMPHCIEEFGNTSCTTIPMLMVSRIREDLESRDLNLILLAFGVGLTWGCVNLKTKKIVCPPMLEI